MTETLEIIRWILGSIAVELGAFVSLGNWITLIGALVTRGSTSFIPLNWRRSCVNRSLDSPNRRHLEVGMDPSLDGLWNSSSMGMGRYCETLLPDFPTQ